MREFIIGKNDCGQRLDRFLTKQGIPISAIMKALRKKDIKVNGKRQPADYILIENDVIKAYLVVEKKPQKVKFEAVSTKINIIYEDENIILLDKPVGLLCHDSSHNCGGDTLINRVKAYLYKKGEWKPENEHSFEPALCNRIDRNTGGIVIAAKNAESLRVMNEKIKLRQITKLYLCILSAIPKEKEATVTAFLEKDEANNTVKITNRKTPSNKTIITKYHVLEERGGLALAEIDLLTGRTHQIRAHMAFIGCPLLGDGKYGKKSHGRFGKGRQALYSYKLIFNEAGENLLDYLHGKQFEVDSVWFLEDFDMR